MLLRKSMYRDTDVELTGKTCECAHGLSQNCVPCVCHHLCLRHLCLRSVAHFSCPEAVTFTIRWYLRYYPCHNEFNNVEVST